MGGFDVHIVEEFFFLLFELLAKEANHPNGPDACPHFPVGRLDIRSTVGEPLFERLDERLWNSRELFFEHSGISIVRC